MGASATIIGDTLTCCRSQPNPDAVFSNTLIGGRDIDEDILDAVKQSIQDRVQILTSRVRLSIQCQDLPNLDTFTLTDGMCVLYKQQGNIWMKIGQTEIIEDNLNPRFIKQFYLPYNFEIREKYKIDMYDIDDFKNIDNYQGHDFIGHLEFTLHEVITSPDQTLTKNLVNTAFAEGLSGVIKITADETKQQNAQELTIKPIANLNRTSGYHFFLIMKRIGDLHWKPVYKSEIVQASGPLFKWNSLTMLTTDFVTEGNKDREFKFEFFKSNVSGKHEYIGYCNVTISEVEVGRDVIKIYDKKGELDNIKTLSFDKFQLDRSFSFLDYIFGGCEIGLSIAIDFTLSNGNPSSAQSLHKLDMQKNEYLNAIKSVGSILQYYDSDKMIPVFGFGAVIPPLISQCEHCFALNGDIFNPECAGVWGVVEAYKNALNVINLSGPTHFAPILEMVNDMTEGMNVNQDNQKYNILLIITDGIINDLQESIDEIIRGSSLPLSIIIVGVGSVDFGQMEQLDADETPLYSQKLKRGMDADIVQFVPFRQFMHNPMLLAKETLYEVPGQLINYFKKRGIHPNPATEAEKQLLSKRLATVSNLLQPSLNSNSVEQSFAEKQKQKFLEIFKARDIDPGLVMEFLDKKGLYSLNEMVVYEMLNKWDYENPLKRFDDQPNRRVSNISMGMNQPVISSEKAANKKISSSRGVIEKKVEKVTAETPILTGTSNVKLEVQEQL